MNKIIIGTNILGLLFLLIGFYLTIKSLASSDWNKVEGTIVGSKISSQVTLSNQNTYTGRDHQIQYTASIVYEYQVDGVTYQNRRFSIGAGDSVKGGFKQRDDAREWLVQSAYKTGNKVIVYVNPNNAQDAVISKGFNFYALIPIIMA